MSVEIKSFFEIVKREMDILGGKNIVSRLSILT